MIDKLTSAQQLVKDMLELRDPARYVVDTSYGNSVVTVYDKVTAHFFSVHPAAHVADTVARITAPALS